MPKATHTPTTPTRRAVFRGLGLASIAAGLAARSALAAPAAPAAAPDADAELIRLCGEFDRLEHLDAHFEGHAIPWVGDAWDDREAAIQPLRDARDQLATAISGIPARTHAGLVAKLRSFVAYDKEETIDLGGGSDRGEAILASACRDAMGLPVAKADDSEEPIGEESSALLASICRKPVPMRRSVPLG
jgi:hypothetical protein